jgi:hypothetical protein
MEIEYIVNSYIEEIEIDIIKNLTNVKFEGLYLYDYPDYCDAYIVHAEYLGIPLVEEELYLLEEKYPELILEFIYSNLIV